jgi:argininosuccinate lyase
VRTVWGSGIALDEAAERFGQSMASDLRFWREDVEGSIAHARMLSEQGIVSGDDAQALVRGLEQILAEGPGTLPQDAEDVHTAVEARLGELVGSVAGRLHTGRSRNDQVSTDFRLWLKRALQEVCVDVKLAQTSIHACSWHHRQTPMPGYTHMQRAQVVTLGFALSRHFWALQRDGHRLQAAMAMADLCPLGSGALAGTSLPIDRRATAETLGFGAVAPHALDATTDRSFALDALHALLGVMTTLSQLSQEMALWATAEFGFVRLDDSYVTGSSLMPQKRNPDMAELIRGRASRLAGHYVTLAGTLKAMPFGYNRDLQDDKPPVFDAVDVARDSLALVTGMVASAKWDKARMAAACADPGLSATDAADALVRAGRPFREAHHEVRALALSGKLEWSGRPLDSALRRESEGGSGKKALTRQLRRAKALLQAPGFDRIS